MVFSGIFGSLYRAIAETLNLLEQFCVVVKVRAFLVIEPKWSLIHISVTFHFSLVLVFILVSPASHNFICESERELKRERNPRTRNL